ncbi:Uncharacterized protein Fot_12478 [Forsythia ovata]|uniref:CSC1/OSCA1-like cytosolic domain-containing protein n=1 Tax=Forsythia ovata TaxID=205694 RepID=A0ABD1WMM5_9LAMI
MRAISFATVLVRMRVRNGMPALAVLHQLPKLLGPNTESNPHKRNNQEISAVINILGAIAFLLAFALLRSPKMIEFISPNGTLLARGPIPMAVYNANKFARLIRKRDRLQNWLDYNQLKFERHPEKMPTSKIKGFLGLCGKSVDSIDLYKEQIKELDKKLTMERQRILKDPKAIIPTTFVSFNSRWGVAVCAQTQQSKNPALWFTNWAPEPRDVYWKNLSIPFVSLSIRKLVISLLVFALVFFYMIPIVLYNHWQIWKGWRGLLLFSGR